MSLEAIYTDLLLQLGFEKTNIDKHWKVLEKKYSSKNRKYHNLTHISNMVLLYETYKERLNHKNEVLYALFYHDIIYKITRKDNEIESAKFAIQLLPKITTANRNLIYNMICATQLHKHNIVEDINWLIDFDLHILASDWENYQVYFQQIRKEYKIYPNLLYNPGRKKALEHFLENDFIFQTNEFRIKYDAKARENIQKEINQL
ncbi:conserved hypothetical protein [Flavobacterium sp. 9AF]|uniref:HD domain-containing protein n=1 Tax=Flavobacterium sp. 9AF TaxID=2653142 RepID=UPI0012EFEC99|nr:hypothetical protein [Flavobacterium sp. 9AF]VXB85478.1 conserved hypothetical protein [Flavobacterium sp. 9AF]